MVKENKPKAAPGQWSGRFGHPDTKGLLELKTALFSLDRFREKRWCYMGIIHPDIIFGCAVVHLAYLSSAFAFAFDRQQKEMMDRSYVLPPMGQVRYDRNPDTGVCSFKSPLGSLVLTHETTKCRHLIQACFGLPNRSLKADISVEEPAGGIQPMHFLMPMEHSRTAFTSKIAGLTAKGKIRVNKKQFLLSPDTTFAVFDWTDGFYPRNTFWNWACGAGLAHDGTRVGFNFSSGVYENGLLENTVWINGTPVKTSQIRFTYDDENPCRPWQINSRDGAVRLIFTPEGMRRADDNLGFIKSRFIQPCGAFEGKIKISGLPECCLSAVGGVVEEHFAKW